MIAPFSLTLNNISLSRGERTLVSGFSLTVSNADLAWVRGDNGIGKTSLLRMAAGLLRPDAGEAVWQIGGQPVDAAQVVGFQGHKDALKPTLTLSENLAFWARLWNRDQAHHEAIERVGLNLQAEQKAGTLSAGQSRRAAIARLLIAQKPLWILDEPTAAIDAPGRALIDSLIVDHLNLGGAALIASHAKPQTLSQSTRQIVLKAAS